MGGAGGVAAWRWEEAGVAEGLKEAKGSRVMGGRCTGHVAPSRLWQEVFSLSRCNGKPLVDS